MEWSPARRCALTAGRRPCLASGLLLLVLLPLSSIASAECVRVTLDVPEAFRMADVVFSGVVTRVDDVNDRLGFRVERVWKGPVLPEIWIQQLGQSFIEVYVFRPRTDIKYIIFGRRVSVEERPVGIGPDERVAFGIRRFCGDGPLWSAATAHQLDQLAKGKKPL